MADVEADDRAVRLSRQSRSPFYWTSNSKGGATAKKEMQIMIHGQTRWSYGVRTHRTHPRSRTACAWSSG